MKRLFLVWALSTVLPGQVKSPELPVVSDAGAFSLNVVMNSNPQGIDFRPYLTAVQKRVKRNWLEEMPRSAKNHQGQVAIQFAIARNGSTSTLEMVAKSGKDNLDRAAIAAISSSNPFEALPAGFEGDKILVRCNFGYNLGKK